MTPMHPVTPSTPDLDALSAELEARVLGMAAANARLRRMVGDLEAEVRALRDEVRRLTECPECNGAGRRWYALYGDANCLTCRGTGVRV